MAIFVLVSAGGSPGVTTTGLGLALTWPREVLLADCDRHPNQAVLAGYLRGVPAGGRGLSGLAQTYRAQLLATSERLVDQTVPLDANPTRPRRFLPGFTNPGSAVLFDRFWPQLVAQFDDLHAHQSDVLVDSGRLEADGLPEPLLARARKVLVLTRSDLPALAALRIHLPDLRAAVAASTAELELVVVGGGRPYPATEIAHQLELPLAADLAWDPTTAAVLSQGDPPPKKLVERPLWRGCHGLATTTAAARKRVPA